MGARGTGYWVDLAVPDDDELSQIYQNRFNAEDRVGKDAIWQVLVREYFQGWVAENDVVVDVGCGFGEFLNHVKCGRRIGIDMNPDSAGALASGITFLQGSPGRLNELPEGGADVVFTSNFLEHLANKEEVTAVVQAAKRCLRPGGTLIAMGPNIRVVGGAYWDFWDHHVAISDRSLVEVLEASGFEVVDCVPQFLPYTTRSPLPKRPWLVSWYLRLPLIWPVFGAQFLVRAQKR